MITNQMLWRNLLISMLLMAFVIMGVNVLAIQYDLQWDLTQDGLNSLSLDTIQTLETLPSPVSATAFYSKNYPSATIRTLLENFDKFGGEKFSYQFIDPKENPLAAQQMGVIQDGTVVVTMQERNELVRFGSEQEMVAAIVRLLDPTGRSAYFLTGHGEYSLDSKGSETGYSTVFKTLQAKNYQIAELNLLTSPIIPEGAQVLVIAGYQSALTHGEIELISNYVQNGGSLIALIEPTSLTKIQENNDPLVDYLLETWGIAVGNNMIIDPNANPPLIAITNVYKAHPIVNALDQQRLTTIFPTARSVEIASIPETVSHSTLAVTSKSAWAESNMSSISSNLAIPDPEDQLGPITLAIAAQDYNSDSRLVVVGDADFANDEYFSRFGNGDFIVNAIDWTVKDDNKLNLVPKNITRRSMVTPTRTTLIVLFIGTVVLIPGLIAALGIINWNSRKRKG